MIKKELRSSSISHARQKLCQCIFSYFWNNINTWRFRRNVKRFIAKIRCLTWAYIQTILILTKNKKECKVHITYTVLVHVK